MKVNGFEDLLVWKKAHALTLVVYQETKSFPREEQFGLVSQLRRAVVSIPANIAEGCKRRSRKDYAHFINMAHASLEECKYYLILSRDLSYFATQKAERLIADADEVGRMLYGLHKALVVGVAK